MLILFFANATFEELFMGVGAGICILPRRMVTLRLKWDKDQKRQKLFLNVFSALHEIRLYSLLRNEDIVSIYKRLNN